MAIGIDALTGVTTGAGNIGIGHGASDATTTTDNNVGIGFEALGANTSHSNIGIGSYSGDGITTGHSNVCLGYQAGTYGTDITTGSANILLGAYTSTAATDNDYSIVIGYDADGKGSTTSFINANGGAVYAGNNSANFSTTSDRRIKKNIEDNNIGLDKINQVRVRNFEYRLPEEVDPELPSHAAIDKEGMQIGVIAQEIMEVLPDVVKQETTGCYSVDPDSLIWYLVNAVKELSAEVEQLKSKAHDKCDNKEE